MQEAARLLDLSPLLSFNNLIVIITIQTVLSLIKATLDKVIHVRHSKIVEILLPYLPLIFGGLSGFIPDYLDAVNLQSRIMLGVALGALSGQIWKILKTKLDLLKGKFDAN